MVADSRSMTPVEVGGEMILVPGIMLESLNDLRGFATVYQYMIDRILGGFQPLPDHEYQKVSQADGKWKVYVHFTWLVVSGFA